MSVAHVTEYELLYIYQQHRVREKFVEALQTEFPDIGLKYSIGGQISFDVFPIGWDKTFCLGLLDLSKYREVHFFGDKAYPVSGVCKCKVSRPSLECIVELLTTSLTCTHSHTMHGHFQRPFCRGCG